MGIIIQKFGGKLVSTKENMKTVAEIIIKQKKLGNNPVVVISAIGNTTDKLQNKIDDIKIGAKGREVDVVLSAGEQISMGLLCIMLNSLGYKAISLTGNQAGILTDSNYTDANILSINSKKIKELIKQNYIVVVAGFQGVDSNGNITTLGRGGSDTTAVSLSKALNADCLEIYKDTESICTADPKLIPTAKKIKEIGYNQMMDLAKTGAKVLAYKSIKFAKDNNIIIRVKSTKNPNIQTIISKKDYKENIPFISCAIKKFSNRIDIITFVKNCNYVGKINIKAVMKKAVHSYKINDYLWEIDGNKIGIIINNKYSKEILENIHNELIKIAN